MKQHTRYTISQIPFVRKEDVNGRFLCSTLFYDDANWRLWMPADSNLVELSVVEPIKSFYFAQTPAKATDPYFHFLDFIALHASFEEIKKPFRGIMDDIHNMSASLAKVIHLHTFRETLKEGVKRMLVTEVEYLIFLCRGVFDLLQEILANLWQFVRLNNPPSNPKSLKNKKKFSDIVISSEKESTYQQITEKTMMPDEMVACYQRHARFFFNLRKFRNNLIHHGSPLQTIFIDDRGFLIREKLASFDVDIWYGHEKQKNDLVPLLPALGLIVNNTLGACEDFSLTLSQIIKFPEALVPGQHLYMRGNFNEPFMQVLKDVTDRINYKAQLPGTYVTGLQSTHSSD